MFDSISLNSLGQWPIIQFGVLLMMLGGGILAWRRGEKDQPKHNHQQQEDERQRMRDAIAASLLKDTANQIMDDVQKILAANREAFFKVMAEQEKELSDRLRLVEIEHARFKERLSQRGMRD